MKNIKNILLVLVVCFFVSCSKDDYAETSPVVLDITQVPYQKLSDYKFFQGELKNQTPSFGVIPYKPINELFSDYAKKSRFIWLPNNTKATYNGDGNALELPVGAALIKSFYYTNVQPSNTTKIIETRVMIRKETEWIFAEYVWNDEQSDAFLTTQSSQVALSWRDENNIIQNVNYKTPSSVTDCKRCHGLISGEKKPLGIKPQNLNSIFEYTDEAKNQLQKLVDFGYLENNIPNNIVTVVDYNDVSKSIDLRVRSYFDANCSHCHVDGGEADHQELRFAFNQTDILENMGVNVRAEHFLAGYSGRIVIPQNVGQSILHYRVNTETDNYFIMPPLGRSKKHNEGVALIEQWIKSLE